MRCTSPDLGIWEDFFQLYLVGFQWYYLAIQMIRIFDESNDLSSVWLHRDRRILQIWKQKYNRPDAS